MHGETVKFTSAYKLMQYGVFPRMMSQGKCRKFCGFKNNVNFMNSCRMESELGIFVLPVYRNHSVPPFLNVLCSTRLCVKLQHYTNKSDLGEWKLFVATVLAHFSSKWCYQFITPCQTIIQAKPHDDKLSLLADCVI